MKGNELTGGESRKDFTSYDFRPHLQSTPRPTQPHTTLVLYSTVQLQYSIVQLQVQYSIVQYSMLRRASL